MFEAKKYTVGEYSSRFGLAKRKISKRKLNSWRFRLYLRLISLFPQIKLVGLSGSISMMNAKKEDDIDLFIITAKNRLFTGRFTSLILAFLLGLKRKRNDTRYALQATHFQNKVCLNLFFDERELGIPRFKQSVFVGHEVLQMKPVINKDRVYERFLEANQWVMSFFPNTPKISNFKFLISNQFPISKFKNYELNKNLKFKIENFSGWLEGQLKKFQLKLIKTHQTTEIITNTQLWFHPDDFEKKIKLP